MAQNGSSPGAHPHKIPPVGARPTSSQDEVRELSLRSTGRLSLVERMQDTPLGFRPLPVAPPPPDQTERYDVGGSFSGQPTPQRRYYDPETQCVILRSVDGELRTVLFVIPDGEVSLGRSLDCGHCIIEQSVSRIHATLRLDDTGLTIRDETSIHGVLVNGKRLNYARIHDKDIIELGNVMLQMEIVPRESLLGDEVQVRWPGDHRAFL